VKPKNRYAHRSRISEAKFRQLVRFFVLDVEATKLATLTSLNRNTVNRYIKGIRLRIAAYCEAQSPFSGEIEVDESWFGGKHPRNVKGAAKPKKTIVFGLFKRNGSVYTEIVPNVTGPVLKAAIRGRVELKSTIYSDGGRGYMGLVDLGYGKHLRVRHEIHEYARGPAHINGIEGFWGWSKMRLVKFRGLDRQGFYLHLKECEFRYNYRKEDLYKKVLEILRHDPLN
jgi:transposase